MLVKIIIDSLLPSKVEVLHSKSEQYISVYKTQSLQQLMQYFIIFVLRTNTYNNNESSNKSH